MAESYPPPTDRSSPALPELPEQPQGRFQFSLKQLLAFMLISCGLAMVARLLLQLLGRLPKGEVAQLFVFMILSLTGGFVLYFLIRVPFLFWHASRLTRRWRTVSRHRQELASWAKAQSQAKRSAESDAPDKDA